MTIEFLKNFNHKNMGHPWYGGRFFRVALISDLPIKKIIKRAMECKFNSTIHVFRNINDLINSGNKYEVTIGYDNPDSVFSYTDHMIMNTKMLDWIPKLTIKNGEYKCGSNMISIINDVVIKIYKPNRRPNLFKQMCKLLMLKYQHNLSSHELIANSYGIVNVKFENFTKGEISIGGDEKSRHFGKDENFENIKRYLNNFNLGLIQEKIEPYIVISGFRRIQTMRKSKIFSNMDIREHECYKLWNRDTAPEIGKTKDGRIVLFDIDQMNTLLVVEEYNGQKFNFY